MKNSVSTEWRLGLEGKLWEQLEKYLACKKLWYHAAKDVLSDVLDVYTLLLLQVSLYILCIVYSVWLFAGLCTPQFALGGDNSGILPSEVVGGRGQKSQWVKRLLGCVSARPWWGCRRTSPLIQQCMEEQPFSCQQDDTHVTLMEPWHIQSTKV